MIKNQQDFWSGVMFIVLGGGFSYLALDYNLGNASRMGPGYFPFWLGILLALLGAIILLSALKGEKKEDHKIGHFDWDILLLIIGSVISYGYLLENLGLYISVVVLVVFSSLASHEFSLPVAIGNAVFLLIFSWLAFVKGLGLTFTLWPQAWADWTNSEIIITALIFIIGFGLISIKTRKGVAK